MPRTYHLELKGHVGGETFNLPKVDAVLADNPDTDVHILVDSLGGSFCEGVSISNSFARHGRVNVHLVSLTASAATIAALGAARVTMDANAMYLIHQVSTPVCVFEALNADQLQTHIDDCGRLKDDLAKLDDLAVQLYARKCKKDPKALLSLLKAGGWLTAAEAAEWGFVDEVTDDPADATNRIPDAILNTLSTYRAPRPTVLDRILARLDAITGRQKEQPKEQPKEASVSLTEPRLQPDKAEPRLQPDKAEQEHAELRARIAALEAENAQLRKTPADTTAQVNDIKPKGTDENSLTAVWARARAMYDKF